MTLVLTVATANKVIQASDRLITYPNGTDYDANKAIIVTCRDAHFVISFTGAALIGTGRPTDEWIGDYLTTCMAYNLDMHSIAAMLSTNANRNYAKFSVKYLSMILCGYWQSREFAGLISNFEQWNPPKQFVPGNKFGWHYVVSRERSASRGSLFISIEGRSDLVSKDMSRKIKWLRKKRFFHNNNSETIAAKLVSVIREIAATPGSMVGRDCLTVALQRDAQKPGEIQFHPNGKRPLICGPYVVAPGISIKKLETNVPSGWTINLFPKGKSHENS
jgi:hypothetical protein